MKRLIFILLLLPVMAYSEKPEQLVHNTSSYVDDFANIYTPEQENELGQIIKQFFDTVQIGVVTVNSLEGYDISDYTVKVFNAWGIGSKSNNGLLLLIAPNEHKAWATTGRAIQGDLTDLKAARLQREIMVPYFKRKEYFDGTKELLTAYIQALSPSAREYNQKQGAVLKQAAKETFKSAMSFLGIGALCFLLAGIIVMVRRRRREARYEKERMEREASFNSPGLGLGSTAAMAAGFGARSGYSRYSDRPSDRSRSRSYDSDSDSGSSNSSSGSSSSSNYDSSSGSDFGGGSSDGGGGGADW